MSIVAENRKPPGPTRSAGVLSVLLALIIWAKAAQAQPSSLEQVTNADLAALQSIRGAILSPDGSRIAFVQNGGIWVLSTRPGSQPTRVADGTSPAWSPDGRSIAFFAKVPETRGYQVFTLAIGSGEINRVTRLETGVYPDGLDWSTTDRLVFLADMPLEGGEARSGMSFEAPPPAVPDSGTPMVLTTDSPDGWALAGILSGVSGPQAQSVTSATEVFVHDLAKGQTRRLTTDGQGYGNPAWSPDGGRIVCTSRLGRAIGWSEVAILLLDPETGEGLQIAPGGGSRKVDPTWSPDGDRIAFRFIDNSDASRQGVGLVERGRDGTWQEPRALYQGLALASRWAPDGESVYVVYNEDVSQPLAQVDLSSGSVRDITGGLSVVHAGSVSISGRGDLAWTATDGDTPIVLRFRPSGSRRVQDLYDPNPQVRDWALGEQEVVEWRNGLGHLRRGILLLPAGYHEGVRYPLLVSAYSQGSHLNGFFGETLPGYGSQAYASRGYAVFFPGPRLPWMYGTFHDSEALRGPDGWAVTVDDIESGVDLLIERGIVDPDRMAVMGHSNGGAAAVALVTSTDRYKGAIAVAPANLNWLEIALHTDDAAGRFVTLGAFTGIGKEVWEDPEAYLNGSIVLRMYRVKTPLLLAVGDRDHPSFTLPTIDAFLMLRSLGRDVTLLRYADQGHVIYGTSGEDLNRRIHSFLERVLGPVR